MRDVRAFEIERLEERVMLAAELLADIASGSGTSSPELLTAVDGKLFFKTSAVDDHGILKSLYVTDGTTQGTKVLLSTYGHFGIEHLIGFRGALYFSFEGNGRSGLWRSDGTAGGTQPILTDTNLVMRWPKIVDDQLYFSMTGSPWAKRTPDAQIWSTGGTAANTRHLATFESGDASVVDAFAGNLLIDTGKGYYVADSTSFETSLLTRDAWIPREAAAGSHLVFAKYFDNDSERDDEVWSTDGTSAGTMRLLIWPNNRIGDQHVENMIAVRNKAIFTFEDLTHGLELWVTDGTSVGTGLLKDIRAGETGCKILTRFISSADHQLAFFIADDGLSGPALWRTDGSSEGTILLKSFGTEVKYVSIGEPTSVGRYLFFSATVSKADAGSLWFTDGSPAGTFEFSALDSRAGLGSAVFNSRVFYAADDGLTGTEIWSNSLSGKISGTVFRDENADGQQSSGEIGLAGWRVYVDLNGDGVPNTREPSARTSSTGRYEIRALPPGTYTIRQTRVRGFAASTNESFRVVVSPFGSVVKKFGNAIAGTVRGYVFDDTNHNGVRDTGEAGLFNFRVFIDLDNDGVLDLNEPTAHTNSAGRYEIADVLPGDYRIRLKPKGGYVSTTQKSFGFSLSAGGTSSKRFGVALI